MRFVENAFREQFNEITSFLDAGVIYGSTTERASQLREFVGGRMLLTQSGLPTDTNGTECKIPRRQHDKRCFAAGKVFITVLLARKKKMQQYSFLTILC